MQFVAAQAPLAHSCGEGVCGTCRVQVLSGGFDTNAGGVLAPDEVDNGWVLACQMLPKDDLEIAL